MLAPRTFTEEQRKEGQEKRLRRIAEQKAYAEEHLILEYGDDMKAWEEMARKIGFRLPPNYIPPTEVKYYRKFLRHIGQDIHWWRDVTGCHKFEDYAAMNPQWTCKALLGTLLENINYIN